VPQAEGLAMSQEPPIPRQDNRSTELAVMQWGDGDGDERARPRRVARFLAELRLDRRLGPLVGGLGAVAGYASLVGEWTITTLPDGRGDGSTSLQVPAGVAEIGGFGIGYLFGLFGLVACLALVLFGAAPTVRHSARVAGLATAGSLLVVLLAATATLHDATERQFRFDPVGGYQVEYGRGLVMAFAATALFGLAHYLCGPLVQRALARTAGGPDGDPDDPAEAGRPGGRGGWPRRRRDAEPEPPAAAPSDLTVTPAAPFARPDDGSR
jgi:hypothetical protein